MLSDKQLLRKASSRCVPASFLSEFQEHIRATYPAAVEVLDKWSTGEYLPTPTLEMIKHIIYASILENVKEKSPRVAKPAKSKSGVSGSGRYSCQLFVKNVTNEKTGEHEVSLFTDHNGIHTFLVDTFQAAMNLVDRKQTQMGNSICANIANTYGKEITTVVHRDDSISRTMRAKKGPACRDNGQGFNKPFENFMSCHQDTASFSRG
jgi:hypothetical protein